MPTASLASPLRCALLVLASFACHLAGNSPNAKGGDRDNSQSHGPRTTGIGDEKRLGESTSIEEANTDDSSHFPDEVGIVDNAVGKSKFGEAMADGDVVHDDPNNIISRLSWTKVWIQVGDA